MTIHDKDTSEKIMPPFSTGDRVKVVSTGHAHNGKRGVVQKCQLIDQGWLVEVYVRELPAKYRTCWHIADRVSSVQTAEVRV